MRLARGRCARRLSHSSARCFSAGAGRVRSGTGGPQDDNRSRVTSSVAELQKVEVKQYKGKDLSSVADFRENSIKGPQSVDPKTYRLKITGKVAQPQSLTIDEVKALPRVEKLVTLNCVEGWSVDILWQGVLLKDLLAKAGYDQQREGRHLPRRRRLLQLAAARLRDEAQHHLRRHDERRRPCPKNAASRSRWWPRTATATSG